MQLLSAAHLSFVLVMPPSALCVHLVGTVLQFALAGLQGSSIQLHIASYTRLCLGPFTEPCRA